MLDYFSLTMTANFRRRITKQNATAASLGDQLKKLPTAEGKICFISNGPMEGGARS